jgi:hypothetical protein
LRSRALPHGPCHPSVALGPWVHGDRSARGLRRRWDFVDLRERRGRRHSRKAHHQSAIIPRQCVDGSVGDIDVERERCPKLHRLRRLERHQTDFGQVVNDSSHLEYELHADVHGLRRLGRAVETGGRDTAGTHSDAGGFSHDDQQPWQLHPDLDLEQCRSVQGHRWLARGGHDQRHVVDRCPVQHYRV